MTKVSTISDAAIRIAVVASFICMIVIELKPGFRDFGMSGPLEYALLFPSLLTPAPYTLEIQSLVYGMMGAFVIYQLGKTPESPGSLSINQMNLIRLGFIFSSIFNVLWVIHFRWGNLPVSLIFLTLLFAVLLAMNSIFRTPRVHKKEKLFVKAPLAFSLGWVTVVIMAHVTILLAGMSPEIQANPQQSAMAFLVGGTLLSLSILFYYRNTAFGLVVLWTYGGILANHLSREGLNGRYQDVMLLLVTCMVILVVATVYSHLNKRLS